MDFFATHSHAEAAEAPIKVQLRDYFTGSLLLHKKKPMIVLVKGSMNSSILPKVRKISDEQFSKIIEGKKESKEDEKRGIPSLAEFEEQSRTAAKDLIVGFENMQVADEDGNLRPMDASDVDRFLASNWFSMEHHLGNLNTPEKGEDEPDEEFEKRQAEHKNSWRKASYAQQVVDASNRHMEELGKPKSA
ncbi:hypothetical protein [Epibacterium ulvae]|uniref:hypothetical protein n=1 Tax=Epibacterium ulvae TaxID=1156985 RepID=UPI002493B6A3|nr:hypothetical protein [Epibacterium ulvae]